MSSFKNDYSESVKRAALRYAEKGFNVVVLQSPLGEGKCSCGKDTCPAIGKHPITKHGVKDATTNYEIIGSWTNRERPMNIGIATGEKSGILAVDVDERHGGHESLYFFEKKNGVLPKTRVCFTGNGKHLYFRYPKGIDIKCPTEVLKGIDIRGNGGYVVAPPSLHASGVHYQWEDENVEIAEMPPALLKLITSAKTLSIDDYDLKKAERAALLNNTSERNPSSSVSLQIGKDFDSATLLVLKTARDFLEAVNHLKK
ncbi:MAG: bifunctional DNA primase/polymerase [Oligoflexia bacterium]|nr:bifunctional DNA primase/polymerase [Oligoflexia bacterium]